MTLAQWHAKTDRVRQHPDRPSDRYVVDYISNNHERSQLWKLSDYRVKYVSGGVIWLETR